MKALLLRHDDRLSWVFMPQVLDRIERFCRDFDTDSDPQFLRRSLMQHFVSDRPAMLCFAGFYGMEVVAHCLVQLEEWSGKIFVNIYQYQADRRPPREELLKGWLQIVAWAQAHGAVGFQILARNRRLARVFQRFYGFEEKRILMRRDLSSTATALAETVPETRTMEQEVETRAAVEG